MPMHLWKLITIHKNPKHQINEIIITKEDLSIVFDLFF